MKLRLALALALAMAVVLAASGVFLYAGVRSTLDEQIDDSLRARTDELAALPAMRLGGGGDERFAQVVERETGRVLAATSGLDDVRVLTEEQLRAASSGPVVFDREPLPGFEEGRVRVRAVPSSDVVLVAGASLEDRDDALASMRTLLLLVGPLALLVASGAGYGLAAATLRPMVARLRAGLARERRFVAEASHELRTPLSLLKTELELALRRPRSPEELRGALASAAGEVDRLTLLADGLLALAQSDEARLRLDREAIDVRELLDRVARRFAARAEELGRRIDVDAEPGLVVEGDGLRLEQALGNLVDNALRHGRGAVQVRARRRGDAVALAVADEGGGFPPEFLPHAFDRFSRAGDARGAGGAGLGLALVAAVARAHGGRADASNPPDGGAEVVLVLPGR